MGLFQNACITYDNCTEKIGIYEGREPFAPIGHIVTSAGIEISIDKCGNFCSATLRGKDESKVIIPVTEESFSRTSKPAPHPLCDQIGYIAAFDDKSADNQKMYLSQLKQWINAANADADAIEVLQAIYHYVEKNEVIDDLSRIGILKVTDKGLPKDIKSIIIWRVLGIEEPCVWKNRHLMDSYRSFYLSESAKKNDGICMVSGKKTTLASQHLKGIFSLNGNAKLISANDTTNFTYRGRFLNADQALTIGYEESQKAHNALKWLIANQAVILDGRAFLCWCPEGIEIPSVNATIISSFFKKELPKNKEFPDYKESLQKALWGYKSLLKEKINSKAVVACFDAATTGRLAMTFYSEHRIEDFLNRLARWEETCCWYNRDGIISPSLKKIVECTYGTERDRTGKGKLEVDDRIGRQQIERLLHCRLGETLLTLDIVHKAVQNASKLMNYGTNTRWDVLQTACALVRKYKFDHDKEDIGMSLDAMKPDRSYQFGRLLAVYEKMERDTFGANDTREPNAIRLQSVYCNQPLHYAFELEKQMERAYLPRLKVSSRVFYKNLIGEIMEAIHKTPEHLWNAPLKDSYLIGYYLQRKELYPKKNTNTVDLEEEV